MEWQRARSAEKKSERREAIYDAATALFKKHGYENVSFNGIAAEAGFTKSNMYRYFSSREEIFLAIFADRFENWAGRYVTKLKAVRQNEDAVTFAKAWVDAFKSDRRFLDLTPLLFVALERNSSFEQLVQFKSLAKSLLFGVAMEISRIYPTLGVEGSFRFLNMGYALTSSLWAASTENKVLKKIYSRDEFREMRTEFDNDLISSLEVTLLGLQAKYQSSPNTR